MWIHFFALQKIPGTPEVRKVYLIIKIIPTVDNLKSTPLPGVVWALYRLQNTSNRTIGNPTLALSYAAHNYRIPTVFHRYHFAMEKVVEVGKVQRQYHEQYEIFSNR